MYGTVSTDSIQTVATRLKQARFATGLSTRAVSERIQKQFPQGKLSHTAISKYEKGESSPPVKTLDLFASVYGRPVEWFLEPTQPLTGIRYRSGSRVLVSERHQYESLAQHWLEAYAKLERQLNQPLVAKTPIRSDFQAKTPKELAVEVRKIMGLDASLPVFSVVSVLEHFGVRVIELSTKCKIDGLAATLGSEPVVVLNPATANDRGRMNAAHELGHILYRDCNESGKTSHKQEDRAFEFGVSLLISDDELAKAFEGRSAVKLVEAKERFGISMAAMVYRAEKIGVIDARVAKKLWIQFAKRGWRAKEPGNVRADKAIRFEKLLDSALAAKTISWSSASRLMRVTRNDLVQRLNQAMGLYQETDSLVTEGEDEFQLRVVK